MSAQHFRFVLLGINMLLLVLMGLAIYFGVMWLSQQATATDHVKIQAEVNNTIQTSASQAQRQLRDPRIQQLYNSLAEIIPPVSYRDQFIADARKYAADSGIDLQAIAFQDTAATSTVPAVSGAKAIPIQLSFNQTKPIPYENFLKFVEKLENNLQHIKVYLLSMTPFEQNRTLLTAAGLSLAIYVEQ